MNERMRRVFLLCCAFFAALTMFAQSQFVSCERMAQQDCIDDAGRCGVLIIAKRPDLVVTALNAKAQGQRRGMDKKGNYLYELIVDPNDSKYPKVEVSKRGDINRTRFTVNLVPGTLLAYAVNEVEKPIALDDQSSYEPILSADSAAVEIVSSYALECNVSPDLHASVVRTKKKNDDQVNVVIVTIPISSIRIPQDRIKLLEDKSKEFEVKLENYQGKDRDAKFDEWEKLDKELDDLKASWGAAKNIIVYGTNTNRLSISVENLVPEKKATYGVLTIKPEPLTEAGSLLAEGARLFEMRRYEDAKRTFMNVKSAKDFRTDLTPVVNENIADCDSCILYTMYANGMLKKYLSWKKNEETISQKQLVDCATGALEMFQILSTYNPCDYYTTGIEKMQQQIDKIPFDIKFTVVKWQNDYSGFSETGPMPNVEIWGCFDRPDPKYQFVKSVKQFQKLAARNSNMQQMGTSDVDGTIELSFQRSNLPYGFFFVPVGYDEKSAIKFVDMSNVKAQSQGDYTKRQFRMKMYLKQ